MVTASPGKSNIWNIPNLLTMFRIALIVPFMFFMDAELSDPDSMSNFWAFWIFTVATVTDWVDGILARRWNLVTPLGKLLDPLADKLLVACALVQLAVYHGIHPDVHTLFQGIKFNVIGVPAWAAAVIIARELAVTGLRGIAGAEGMVIQASSGGKWKTVIQFIALGGLILQGTVPGTATIPVFGDIGFIAYLCLWVAVVLTGWSGIAYFREFLGKLV
jgi:CDP-diacylglycerol--glycerol-3-phosphate 3-phosphatidyltransferase